MNKNSLDEMQQQKRDKIGSQSFILLCYLILIDVALHGLGFTWLQYPTNIFVLMLASNAYYLVRSIMSNTFLGPGVSVTKVSIKTAAVLVISGIMAAISATMLFKNNGQPQPAEGDSYGAYILLGFSCLIIILTLVTGIVTYIRNKNSKE